MTLRNEQNKAAPNDIAHFVTGCSEPLESIPALRSDDETRADLRAQWAKDIDAGAELERIGHNLRMSAITRRCSEPCSVDDPPKRCTLDKGHHGLDHECDTARDIEGR